MRAASVTESAVPDVLAPGLRSSSAGSTRAASRRRRTRTSRIRATTSGGCCTPRGFTPRLLEPAGAVRAARRTGSGSRTRRRGRRPGSGDLRRADFAGARERLERIARELRPRVDRLRRQGGLPRRLRRAAGARRAGADARRRRSSSSFRRPRRRTPPCRGTSGCAGSRSSPAARAACRCVTPCARVLVVDEDDRVLLVRFVFPDGRCGRRPAAASRPASPTSRRSAASSPRSAASTTSSSARVSGPRRTGSSAMRLGRPDRALLLVRAPAFEPPPSWTAEQLAAEGVDGMRWWTPGELAASDASGSPRAACRSSSPAASGRRAAPRRLSTSASRRQIPRKGEARLDRFR